MCGARSYVSILMRLPLLLLSLVLFAQTTLPAAELKASEMKMKETLHAVITQQLAAFRADDYKAAYVFADASIKEQFPLEAFEQMVRTGYPLIAKSTEAVFGLTLDNGDAAVVNVRVVGANKETLSYQYLLKRDGENWRIAGVSLLEDKSLTV